MESRRSSGTTAIGFSLLPLELVQHILLRLALPDIFQLRAVNKSIAFVISDRHFAREYNLQSESAAWLFVYKKRWHRDSTFHGFTDRSDRWFAIPIAAILRSAVPPGEDLYFLTASSNFFLFALNTSQEVICVNPMSRTVKRIPPSPLGPRGTSSWRRSGMKLLSGRPGSGHFRFLFAELLENIPTVFEYNSETDTWRCLEPRENTLNAPPYGGNGENVLLSASNGPRGSVIIAVELHHDRDQPVIVRPRFDVEENLVVRFSWGNVTDRLHVYGDGRMMIVRSDGPERGTGKWRVLKGVELWGLSSSGRTWELVSKVPTGLVDQVKKPYGVMMGCLEERKGTVRAVLMSNLEGAWDIIWLCYDVQKGEWSWVPLPDCKMKGCNMAGITFSSGLTLS